MKRRHNSNLDAGFRLTMAAMAVLAQIILFIWMANTLMAAGTYLYTIIQAFSVFTIVKLVNRHESPSYKIAWMLVVFMLPVFGLILYFLWGRANQRRFRRQQDFGMPTKFWDPDASSDRLLSEFTVKFPERVRIARYLHHHGFPIYREDISDFYPLGENCFDSLCEDLEGAKQFIFLEFFIVTEGFLWDRVAAILRKKAEEGLEVRFLMDDFGGMKLSRFERNRLRSAGLKLKSFNPIVRHVSNLYLNYRNHQKIISIDGRVAYTGGVNLADEYVNLSRKHGHWKDTAVRVTGEGVWSLTLSFLIMWDTDVKNPERNYLRWRIPVDAIPGPAAGDPLMEAAMTNPNPSLYTGGYIQPFTDGPSNNPHNPAKAVCQQMIESSNRFVWITTPYLILEEDMLDSLGRSAESGVDVRIITPSIPDKWYVHLVTRSHYGRLLHSGVRIYEYTPGFMHAKMIVSDDEHALVGTVNFDFRSFYLQYENAVWFCNSPIVSAVRDDFARTLLLCREISYDDWKKRPWYQKVAGAGLRLFSTLM
jgi:cardiolipin synthase